MFFENGTYQAYDLFKGNAKINTYKSLKWHLLVLWYLNPQLDPDEFNGLSEFIVDKNNGFTTFTISRTGLERIIHEVYMCDLDQPPTNRLRKVIFKMSNGLEKHEKLSIVGGLIGRTKRVHSDDIYQCMIDINDMGKKITIRHLAGLLDCSTRTIHRNMCNELKREKELLNRSI
jgi:transcriptional antiterminator